MMSAILCSSNSLFENVSSKVSKLKNNYYLVRKILNNMLLLVKTTLTNFDRKDKYTSYLHNLLGSSIRAII